MVIIMSRILVSSDAHIGWSDANQDQYFDFLRYEVPSIDPDKFIIPGDLFDMWRMQDETVIPETMNFIEDIKQDAEVEILFGNHDDVLPFRNTYSFSEDGKDYLVLHGHQVDIMTNTVLARRISKIKSANRNPFRQVRANAMKRRLRALTDKTIISGHSHISEASDAYINSGSWTGDNNTFAIIEEGEAEIVEY